MTEPEKENAKAEQVAEPNGQPSQDLEAGGSEGEEAASPDEPEGPHEREELSKLLDQLQQDLDAEKERTKEVEDRYLRLRAEFDNYRRRTRQEVDDIRARAAEGLAAALLPVVDNLERAAAFGGEGHDPKSLAEGVELVLKQLLMELGKVGVEPIEAAGKPFDPNLHEAVAHEESDESPEGTVIEELQKGYVLNDKVLRPSMVKVAKGRSAEGGEDQ